MLKNREKGNGKKRLTFVLGCAIMSLERKDSQTAGEPLKGHVKEGVISLRHIRPDKASPDRIKNRRRRSEQNKRAVQSM